ncbi:hypothetical protein F4561_002829 [Lipingzhangella halophila]|uniref:Uncharacterized protein n=1 Tax=Lipingzhangella halophila TaxID=1783352 RepID=A0A7W7W3P1_9ACTN|nr:hypothetical protein [Lipingzhangella halophila]MBB4932009.1 hypothetical protein [Lipingzhangella halophila]
MPTQAEELLRAHPRDIDGDIETVKTCIERLAECAQACLACSDACLGESDVADLVRCVHLNLDCADVCAAADVPGSGDRPLDASRGIDTIIATLDGLPDVNLVVAGGPPRAELDDSLLTDPVRHENHSNAAVQRAVSNYSWARIVRETETFYREVAAAAAGPDRHPQPA